MENLAPIVLFVYNRPWHTLQTLEALAANDLADQSTLYIFCDGPKENANTEDLNKIEEVRKVIKQKKWCHEVHFIERQTNKGLANSVIDGVTEIVNQYGKIIVLEDDLVTAKGFLKFMNDALEVYEKIENVFSISGYMFPVKWETSEVILLPYIFSWGWATWKMQWDKLDTTSSYSEIINQPFICQRFNIAHYDYSLMLNNKNSWAIRWYYTLFTNNGLSIFPSHSLVLNIGFDGTGENYKNDISSQINQNFNVNNIDVEFKEKIDLKFYSLFMDFFTDNKAGSETKSVDRPYILIKKIAKKVLNVVGVKRSSYNKSSPFQSTNEIKLGNNSRIDNCYVENRKSEKRFLIEVGNDSMISGSYIFEIGTGKINVGSRTFIGGGTFICIDEIQIDDDVMISWGCTVVDNNSHSIVWSERQLDVLNWKQGIDEGKIGFYKNWSNVERKKIHIKNKAWIGFNCIILKGVTIGEGAIVGAGSVVTKDVPDWTIVAGNPAKIIRTIPESER